MMSMFKNDLKQLGNFVVVYIGCLILNFIIAMLSYNDQVPIITFYLIIFIFSLIFPIVNLKYLFNVTKQTHYYSLPFSRLQSFVIHYFSGFICLVVPAIIYCIFIQGAVLKNSLALLIMILIYYTLANLSAYLTTSLFMNIILQVVIIVTPLLLYYSLFAVYVTFIRGVVASGISNSVISYLMPLISLIIAGSSGVSWYYCLIYLGYIVIALILTLFVCKNRNCSSNYYGFTYRFVAVVIKIVIIISGSWMLTSVLGVSSGMLETFIVINIIATVIITFIIQFIYYRKIKYQLCIVEAGLIIVGTVILFIFSKNYLENYIPKSIVSVAIGLDVENKSIPLKDNGSIDKITSIHKELIDTKENGNSQQIVYITYYCADGSEVVRGYEVDSNKCKELVKQFDEKLITSWYSKYYNLLKQFDEAQEIRLYSDNGDNVDNVDILKEVEDIQLLNDILQYKLIDFEKNINLLDNIIYSENKAFEVIFKQSSITINYNTGDPLALAIEDFYKIKAN